MALPRAISAMVVAAIALAFPGDGRARSEDATVHTFEITASRFQYEPETLEVMQAELVRLILRSTDTTHGIAIPAFDVKVVIPKGGESVTVEFVADRAGSFPFKCSEYCGSGHRRMKGRLIVREMGWGVDKKAEQSPPPRVPSPYVGRGRVGGR